MAINFPGPYEIEIEYVIDGETHVQRLNTDCDPDVATGIPATDVFLKQNDGGTIALDVAVGEWIDLIKTQFDVNTTFLGYTLWKYTPETFDRTWITTDTLGVVGTAGGASNPAHMITFTFRSQEGGIMKVVLLEEVTTTRSREAYADIGTAGQDIMDYVAANDTWMLARDTSPPIVPLYRLGGENERIFRKRFR